MRSQVHQAEFGRTPSPEPAAKTIVQEEEPDFPPSVATILATEWQSKIALGVVVPLAAAAIILVPFARMQVARVDAFVVQTVISAADLITAILLFAQYSIRPQLALLAFASGYICSGSFALLQTLAFPGAYAPSGLIDDGFNTAGWLFVLWNATFPAMEIRPYCCPSRTPAPEFLPRIETAYSILSLRQNLAAWDWGSLSARL